MPKVKKNAIFSYNGKTQRIQKKIFETKAIYGLKASTNYY